MSPEGWLWAKTTEAALADIASLKTSRGWTTLESRLPTDISATLISWLRVSSNIARKYSFFLPSTGPWPVFYPSPGVLTTLSPAVSE